MTPAPHPQRRGPVLEVATFIPTPAQRQAFAASLRSSVSLLQSAPGYESHVIGTCAEEEGTFVLFVWWATLEAHVRDFRASAAHREWRGALAQYLCSEPIVRHFYLDDPHCGPPGPASSSLRVIEL